MALLPVDEVWASGAVSVKSWRLWGFKTVLATGGYLISVLSGSILMWFWSELRELRGEPCLGLE